MQNAGSATAAIVKEIMNEVDENGDGKISFEEFLISMQNSMRKIYLLCYFRGESFTRKQQRPEQHRQEKRIIRFYLMPTNFSFVNNFIHK